MNKKISVNLALAIAIIAMTVTFSVTMILSQQMFNKTVASVREKEIMYENLAEIDRDVRSNYYGEINDETLYDMIATGYMAGIGDSNARYYTAAQYLEYLNVQSGAVVSVGVDVVKDPTTNYARVIRVYADSPAQEAGIQKNWYITKIDGTSVQSLSADRISSLLSGDAGTNVTLTMLNTAAEEQTVTIQRRQYDTPSIEWQMVGSQGVGYVRFINFVDSTAEELTEAVEQMQQSETGLKALILDVRNNAGGSLDNAIEVIDALCPVGPIASRLNSDGSKDLIATSDANEVDVPMVVLANSGTSAGAELLAVSVRDFGKGRIVGTTTAGKGSIQCAPVRLSNGAAVSYTIGMLLTGKEESFDGTGVSPDVEISLKAEEERNFYDLTPDTDSQIQKAVETAGALLNSSSSQTSGDSAASSSAAESVSESVPESVSEPESASASAAE